MTENAKMVIPDMLQACKNIMAATDGASLPEAFDKDPFLLENIFMNLVILVESYMKIGDQKADFPTINWEEIGSYTFVINKPADQIDRRLIVSVVKSKIPSLLVKLEKILCL